MGLIKTSILSFFAVIVKMLTLLGINKVLAVYVGANGYATIGQFQNVIQILTLLGSGGINNGIVKYSAEFENNPKTQKSFIFTALTVSTVASLFFSILIFIFSEYLSFFIFGDLKYEQVFHFLSLGTVLLVINNAFLAILNGKRELKKYIISNVCGSFFSLLLTVILTINYSLYGALIALCMYQGLSLIVTISFVFKSNWFSIEMLKSKFEYDFFTKLFKFSLMSITSAIVIPLSTIFVRKLISVDIGVQEAGYWEAAWRLSSAYILVVSSTFSFYFLPKFSSVKTTDELLVELKKGYKLIVPIGLSGAIFVYLFRIEIISFLYSKEFMPVEEIMLFQLAGDFVKVCSVILGYVIVSKAMTKEYIISELFFSTVFCLLVFVLINFFGLVGSTLAYFLSYILHLVLVVFLVWKKRCFSFEN